MMMARSRTGLFKLPAGIRRRLWQASMKYLHTMVRVSSLEQSLDFYCNKLGLREMRRQDNPAGRYTLVFVAAPGDESACLS